MSPNKDPYNIRPKFIITVIFFHALLLWLLFFQNDTAKLSPKEKKLVVQNVKLSSPKNTSAQPSQVLPVVEKKEIPAPIPKETIPEVKEELIPEPQSEPIFEPEPEKSSTPKPVVEEAPVPIEKKPTKPKKKKESVKKPPAPAKKTKPTENKSVIKTKPSAPSTPKVKTPTKAERELSQKNQELLQSIEESIAKIGKKADKLSDKSAPLIHIPKEITSLHIDSSVTFDIGGDSHESASLKKSYEEELSLYLKALLQLPEYGDVRLSLKLNRSGKVVLVKFIKADSEKNKHYLEKALPKIAFPPFGSHFNDSEKTFTLTLSSDL